VLTGNEAFVDRFEICMLRKMWPLETAVTNQNYMHEGVKRRLRSGNAYWHSVHILLSGLE